MKVWCIDPQSGGTEIPSEHYSLITNQVVAYEVQQKWYPAFRIKLRFKKQFCYLDGYEEGKETFPIGRLRYFQYSGWSMAFYSYSNETYKPCLFQDGKWYGTIENAIDICSVYLTN